MNEIVASILKFLSELAEQEELSHIQVLQAISSVFVVLGKAWDLSDDDFVKIVNTMMQAFEKCDLVKKDGVFVLMPKGKQA